MTLYLELTFITGMLAARIEKKKTLHKHVHQRLVLYRRFFSLFFFSFGLDVLSG